MLLLPQAALLSTALLGASPSDGPLRCSVESPVRCYEDGPAARLFANDFVASSADITPELCASICYRAGLSLAGVEAGGECHCGTGFSTSVAKVALNASRCHAPCAGHANATCGGNAALDVLTFSCVGHPVPNYKGCENAISRALPYCDTSLSVDERVSWLMANLSLAEKIATISPQRALGDTCGTHTAGKASIGLPDYFWLTETNSAVFSTCLGQPWRCPTTFIGPLGMGASFNRTSWKQKGGVLGRELRAFYNLAWQLGWRTDRVALTAFGPNINIARDPRFGRSSELPSEDPFHSGEYGTAMVAGMQEKDAAGHPLVLAFLKHFTSYSQEAGRDHNNYNISTFDYWDTYLPQFEAALKHGGAAGVMASYASENGHPSVANSFILNDVIRTKWNREDALVTSDCGAIQNVQGAPANAPSPEAAAAWALMNGTDLEMGSTLWQDHLVSAIGSGLATEAAVTRAASRAMRQHFLAGRFDPRASVGWSDLGAEAINSSFAQQVSREAALMGMVLLKNDGGTLPLRKNSSLAVLGPMAVNTQLMSDYAGGWNGVAGCWPKGDESCIVTIGQAIALANGGSATRTAIAQGVDVNSNRTDGIAAAVALADAAETVVLVLGNDRSTENENLDRPAIDLPGQQQELARQVLALGKPTVLILSNGGAVAIDGLIDGPRAIVEAFSPAQQTPALASLLFGEENRWGRLPYTIYPNSYAAQQPMGNYDMSLPPGRTYKYYSGRPLFEFGSGLSLTTFSLDCHRLHQEAARGNSSLAFSCDISNTGSRDGDEVLMAFHSAGQGIRAAAAKAGHPVPIKSLVGFERVSVAAGRSAACLLELRKESLLLVNSVGDRVMYRGERSILLRGGAGQQENFTVVA